ncbi:uncharacterized protein LOC134285249 [Aedes albopictus]|uniref:CCHC-type domain-containing protein n=1 Tax=Aedes albopictus TaxID=7160 RepID=A0ABM2A3Q7_AEDAL
MPPVQYSPIKPVNKNNPVVNPEMNPNPGTVSDPAGVTNPAVVPNSTKVPNPVEAMNPVVPVVPDPPSNAGQSSSGSSFHGFHWQEQVDRGTMTKLNGLFRQRSQVEQKVVRIQFTLRDQRHLSLAQLNVITGKLAAAYEEFSRFHSEIMALIPDDAEDEQEEIYTAFEDRHDAASTVVQEIIIALNRNTHPAVATPHVVVQQQPLKVPIPTFDGTYSSWPKFKAIFQDLMENSADSDAIKLYHLDKALVGAAAGSLDAKIINEGNYEQAWRVLSDRYENQRLIVESHLRGLLNLKKMSSESSKELRCLLDEATGHVESLRYLKQELTGVSEHLVVFLITAALDKATRKAWESTVKSTELPKYTPTIAFLKSRCQVLENFELSQVPASPVLKPKPTQPSLKLPLQKSNAAVCSIPSDTSCDFCSDHHFNYQCSALKQLTTAQRAEKIRSIGLCFNCLRKGHQSKHCPSAKTCQKCSKKHHTLLHADSNLENTQDLQANVSDPKSVQDMSASAPTSPTLKTGSSVSTICSCSKAAQETKTVLLSTAVVHAIDKNDNPYPCRVLLDSGSQVNFVTETMANLLRLPKTKADVPITGINARQSIAREKVSVSFRSRLTEFQATIECLVTPKVTPFVPSTRLDVSDWDVPDTIHLADPRFHIPDKIDLLIGGELFFDILKHHRIDLGNNLPTLRATSLGWIVTGTITAPATPELSVRHSNIAIVENVEVLEHVPSISSSLPTNKIYEDQSVSTHSRNSTDRFGFRRPFKRTVDQLDNRRGPALSGSIMLENRFNRDPSLRDRCYNRPPERDSCGCLLRLDEAYDLPHQATSCMPHHAVLSSTCSSCDRESFDTGVKSQPAIQPLDEVLMLANEDEEDSPFQVTTQQDFDVDQTFVETEMEKNLIFRDTRLRSVNAHSECQEQTWNSASHESSQRTSPEKREKHLPLYDDIVKKMLKVLAKYEDPKDNRFPIANTRTQLSAFSQKSTEQPEYSEVQRSSVLLEAFPSVVNVVQPSSKHFRKNMPNSDEPLDNEQQRWIDLQSVGSSLKLVKVPRSIMYPNSIVCELQEPDDIAVTAYGSSFNLLDTCVPSELRLQTLKTPKIDHWDGYPFQRNNFIAPNCKKKSQRPIP